MIETKRYQGFRIRFLEPIKQQYAWLKVKQDLQPLEPMFATAITESYMIDDAFRGTPAIDLAMNALTNGEIFVCYHNSNIVGFMILRDIIPGREALLETWAMPDYRKSVVLSYCVRDLLKYAFEPYGEWGLGLRKVKAMVAAPNKSAIKGCAHLGFKCIGVSPADGLFNNQLTDILILELFNPQLFSQPTVEVMPNGKAESPAPSPSVPSPDVHTPSVHAATADSSAGHADPYSGDESGGERRGIVAEFLAAPEPATNRSGRPKAGARPVLQSIRGTGTGTARGRRKK